MLSKPKNEMLTLSQIAAALISAKVAAECIPVNTEVTRIRQRIAALASILASIATEKAVLAEQLTDASGAMQALLQREIDMLTAQENEILERVGVTPNRQQAPIPKGRLTSRTNGHNSANG
jgi:hypothetical protein